METTLVQQIERAERDVAATKSYLKILRRQQRRELLRVRLQGIGVDVAADAEEYDPTMEEPHFAYQGAVFGLDQTMYGDRIGASWRCGGCHRWVQGVRVENAEVRAAFLAYIAKYPDCSNCRAMTPSAAAAQERDWQALNELRLKTGSYR